MAFLTQSSISSRTLPWGFLISLLCCLGSAQSNASEHKSISVPYADLLSFYRHHRVFVPSNETPAVGDTLDLEYPGGNAPAGQVKVLGIKKNVLELALVRPGRIAPPDPPSLSPKTPKRLPGVRTISVEDAVKLIGKATFVDARSRNDFAQLHIDGALSVPYSEKRKYEKSKPLVFYGYDEGDWSGAKAAMNASKAGITRVLWLRSGFRKWLEASDEDDRFKIDALQTGN